MIFNHQQLPPLSVGRLVLPCWFSDMMSGVSRAVCLRSAWTEITIAVSFRGFWEIVNRYNDRAQKRRRIWEISQACMVRKIGMGRSGPDRIRGKILDHSREVLLTGARTQALHGGMAIRSTYGWHAFIKSLGICAKSRQEIADGLSCLFPHGNSNQRTVRPGLPQQKLSEGCRS
jgi:hypothetical protein